MTFMTNEKAARLKGNQINWNQVFYFSEVASCGSIKDAAIKLDLSPSTLSEHITQLERDLDVQLFLRQHRRLVLTPEGNRLYLHSKEMFEAGQRLIDVVSPIPLGCYPVSVGLVPSPSIQLAYKLIGDYIEGHPSLNMKLFHSAYSDLETGLSEARFDFGFADRLPERRDLVRHLISSSVIRFYVAQKWQGVSFSQLLTKLPLLICNAEPNTKTRAETALVDADLPPDSIITSDYPSALVDLCQRGLGIGVFSETPMNELDVDNLRMLRVPRDAPKLQDNLYVLWARDAENTEVVRHLKQLILPEDRRGTA